MLGATVRAPSIRIEAQSYQIPALRSGPVQIAGVDDEDDFVYPDDIIRYQQFEDDIKRYLEKVPDSEYISSQAKNVVTAVGIDSDSALKLLAEIQAARPKGNTNKYMV